MKSRLVNLKRLSGTKASVYSIVTDDCEGTLFDHFLNAHEAAFLEDVLNILGRLRSIGNEVGAMESYFKQDEGLECDDKVCALFDIPEKHLRLYCIRLSEQIIIVGNGGPKNVRAWQQDPKLASAVQEMIHYSAIIYAMLKNGSLTLSDDGLRFKGNLCLIF